MASIQQSSCQTPSLNHVNTSQINSTKSGKFSNHWVLDTWVTDHICYDKNLFFSIHNISFVLVFLPNESQLSVNQSGIVQISPLLTLTGVLYVPSFHVNLIFVSKLTTNHNCLTIFQPSISFIIQTQPLRVIGTAERSHNLYQLRTSSIHQVSQTKIETSRLDNKSSCLRNKSANINKSCVDIDNAKLWHFRMGHLSYDRLKILSSYYSNIFIGSVHPCDTCHFAK